MDFDATCRMIGMCVEPVAAEACRYLEAHGYQFCVDFGTDNAVTRARACLIEHNPVIAAPSGRECIAPAVSSVQWDRADREWLREIERAFGEASNTDFPRPDRGRPYLLGAPGGFRGADSTP